MKTFIVGLALCLFQMNTLQDKPVVHLAPHRLAIDPTMNGKLLELIDAPSTLNLPMNPPKADLAGNLWQVDVKNLGPRLVKIIGKNNFTVSLRAGQTVHILSSGGLYRLTQQ